MGVKIGIVGATGKLGQEVIRQFNDWQPQFPTDEWSESRPVVKEWRLFSGPQSAGKRVSLIDQMCRVKNLEGDSFAFADLSRVIFCAPEHVVRQYVPEARAAGCTVIDCSDVYAKDQDMAYVPTESDIHAGLFDNPGILVPRRRAFPQDTAYDVVRILYSLIGYRVQMLRC